MKTDIFIQARMNSTRVPGKISLNFGGKPLLWHVIKSMEKVKNANQTIVVTGSIMSNFWIVNFCKKNNIKCFSYEGDENNVLERFYQAAKKSKPDNIVRVCADNILISSEETENLIAQHIKLKADYCRNYETVHPDLGAEIMTLKTLEKAHQKATTSFEIEHVTPYIYKTNSKAFKINEIPPILSWPPKIKPVKLCIDNNEDVPLISAVITKLFDGKNAISSAQLIDYFAN